MKIGRVGLMLLMTLTACGAYSAGAPANGNTGTSSPTDAGPTLALTLAQAQQTAGDFLNAWVTANYDAMYGLLHIKSQNTTSHADFVAAYTATAQLLTLPSNSLTYTFTNAVQQADQVEFAYGVTFRTQRFGTFSDADRTLTLNSTPDGWRVVWTPGDIFPQMADGAVLAVETTAPNRGNIYDQNGEVLADQQGAVIEVTLLTEQYPTGNPDDCFAEVASIFPARDAATLKQVYGPYTGRPQGYVVGTLTSVQFTAEKPTLDKVCQLSYQSRPTREYPHGGLAPHIVGYVGPIPAEHVADWTAKGYSPDALVGLDGVEGGMETTLAGRGAATLVLRQNGQDLRMLAQDPGVPAQSVYLTIDGKLQQSLQDILQEAYHAKAAYFATSNGGAAIVMDVHTGEILASASYPSFDENALIPHSPLPDAVAQATQLLTNPRKPTLNCVMLGEYPLGSVFKIVSMAAAVDSGQFALNTLAACPGVWNGAPLGDRLRTNWNPNGNGIINLEQALTSSCDTYFWHLGWTLNNADPTVIPRYARQMGFGAPTGIIGLPEAAGNVPNPTNYPQTEGKNWTGSDTLDLVIGQGTLLVTPLQVVRMVAGVANGGTLYQPLIIKQVGLIGQPSYVAKPVVSGSMNVNPDALAGIRAAMCKVTTDETIGTATFVFRGFDFSKVTVCGKTGTAESGQANPHAWFAAFAGKDPNNPDIAIVAVIENSYEGSYIAAPIVRRIVETYYDLRIAPWPAWYGPTPETVDDGGD
ncbi:MAG: penicillin-binding transpeptidase domain-containing protein [Aggregatilineales bacterium]